MSNQYHGPKAAVYQERQAAMKCALADLSPETRADIESMIFNPRAHVPGVGPDTAIEIIAALAMKCGTQN